MTANFEKDLPLLAIEGSLRLNLRSYDMTAWDFGGSNSADANNGERRGGEEPKDNADEEIPDYGQAEQLGEEEFDAGGAHCIVFKWNGLGWVFKMILKARL